MFRIRAEFQDRVTVRTDLAAARAFFGDPRHFMGLMPGLEKIVGGEDGGALRWLIRAEIPLIGPIDQFFAVRQTDDQPRRIEWGPPGGEQKNLLRYAAAFEEVEGETPATLVRLAQRVELRRARAQELHKLAGLLGESMLSAEMQKRVTEMMTTFLRRAAASLEGRAAR